MKLLHWMKSVGMKGYVLADYLGVDASYVCKLMKGKRRSPNKRIMERLALLSGGKVSTLDDLISEEEAQTFEDTLPEDRHRPQYERDCHTI